jgi:hypothetical protein
MKIGSGREASVERDWVGIVAAQEKWDGSMASFCRARSISYNTFLYHRARIHKLRNRRVLPKGSGALVPLTRERGFIPIRVEGANAIRLRFPGGLVLESEVLPPAGWVVEVAQRWNGEGESSC